MLRRAVLAMLGILLIGGLIAQGVEELAELHVTTITLDPPSSITRGIEVEIRARVMNTGQRNADPVDVGFFYRPMGGSSSWTLASTVSGASLAPSQEDYLEVTFTLGTLDLDLGAYEIRIVADPLNQITEIDELNNELITSFRLVESTLGLADLQPISLSYSPTNPDSSDDMLPWNVSSTIENPTSTQAGAFTVAFHVDGVEFDRQFLFALPANSTVEVLGEFDPFLLGLDAGTYTIQVIVDPDEQVYEQDEANNSISSALTLLSPDLYPTRLAFDKSVVRLDEEVRITADIANGGEGTAKNIDVGFYLDHVRFAMVQVPILGRGLSATVEAILSPDDVGLLTSPEIHEIEIIIDPNNAIPELDEANNVMTRPLTILEPGVREPELHPESIEIGPASPVELGRTDTVTVSAVVSNTGRAAAEDFDVTFFYRVKGGLRWEAFPCSGDAGCADVDLASGIQTKLTGILPVLLLPPGIYEVRVLVDAGSAVSELDETNNEMITTLTLLAARLPDLTFSLTQPVGVEPSTQVHRGQTVRFTPSITNVGDLDAGDFFVRFSYQNVSDAAIAQQAGQAPEFRTAFFSPSADMQVRALEIGETAEIPVLLETRDLDPGQYLVQMEIDPAIGSDSFGRVQERNELNNVYATQLFILGADLSVIGVETEPDGIVQRGEPLEISTTVINTGVTPAGSFTVGLKIFHATEDLQPIQIWTCGDESGADCMGPEFFAFVRLPGIDLLVPEIAQCSLDTTDLVAGDYVIQVIVDAEDTVGEHNEANNIAEFLITIVGDEAIDGGTAPIGEGADLSIRSFHAVQQIEDANRSQAWATIVNQGTEDTEPFYARFYYLDAVGERVTLPRIRVGALLAGADRSVLQVFDTSTLAPGYHVVGIEIDLDNVIPETDEANNTRQTDLLIR